MNKLFFVLTILLSITAHSYIGEQNSEAPKKARGRYWRALKKGFTGVDQIKIVIMVEENGRLLDKVLLDKKLTNDDITELLDAIEIDDKRSNSSCFCHGSHQFRFYRKGKFLFDICYMHGHALRWSKGWPWDGALKEKSRKNLVEWFDKIGFKDLKEEYDKVEQEMMLISQKKATFLSYFPPAAQVILKKGIRKKRSEHSLGIKIAKTFKTKQALGIACCKALAVYNQDSWARTNDMTQLALAAGSLLKAKDFIAVLEALDTEGKTESLRGAAQLFFSKGYIDGLGKKQTAKWSLKLANEALISEDSRKEVTYSLRKADSLEVNKFLKEIVQKKIYKPVVTETKEEFTPAEIDEPSIDIIAYLALATLGDKSIEDELAARLENEKNTKNRAAIEVCFMLLGDSTYLRKEYFKQNSYYIGMAMIEGIEKFNGKPGLAILIEDGLNHESIKVRESAVFALQRITKKTWYKKGSSRKTPDQYCPIIQNWWKRFSKMFMRNFNRK